MQALDLLPFGLHLTTPRKGILPVGRKFPPSFAQHIKSGRGHRFWIRASGVSFHPVKSPAPVAELAVATRSASLHL
jgi:hypothetical protein